MLNSSQKDQASKSKQDVRTPHSQAWLHLPLPGDSQPLILGQVLEGMQPTDKPVAGAQNDPMMPVAWVKTYNGARVFTASVLASRRLFCSAGLKIALPR